MKNSKSNIRFYIYVIAFLPMVLLMATGMIMLEYHTGTPVESLVLGLNGHDWLLFHKIVSVIGIMLIALHLAVKTDWLKRLFTFKMKAKFKITNILIFVFFLLSFITALLSWLVFPNTEIAELLKGIHNKLGIGLIVLFVIHMVNYFKLMKGMIKKLLSAK